MIVTMQVQLLQLQIVLVLLVVEVMLVQKIIQGLTSGAKRIRLRPTIVPEIQPEFLYCRVHRRHGNDRLLRYQALQDWCNLLSQVTNSKIYFLWIVIIVKIIFISSFLF